jgi:hypothetical protein
VAVAVFGCESSQEQVSSPGGVWRGSRVSLAPSFRSLTTPATSRHYLTALSQRCSSIRLVGFTSQAIVVNVVVSFVYRDHSAVITCIFKTYPVGSSVVTR